MLSLDLLAASSLVGCAVYLTSAALALGRGPGRSRPALALFWYALLGGLLSAALAARQLGRLTFLDAGFTALLPFYGVGALAAVFLVTTSLFYIPSGERWGWHSSTAGLGAAWLAGLLALDLNFFGLPETLLAGNGWVVPRAAAGQGVMFSGWLIFTAAAVGMTVRRLRPGHTGLDHNRSAYWLSALGFLAAGDGLLLAGYTAWGSLLRLPGVLLALYAVWVPRLPEFRMMARRAGSFAAGTGLELAAYALLFAGSFYLIQRLPMQGSLPARLALTLVLAAIVTLALNPAVRNGQRRLERRLLGGEDAGTVLRRYSQNITNIMDLQRLASVACGAVGDALGVRRGFLFLVDYEKDEEGQNVFRLRGVKGLGDSDPEPGQLQELSPLVQHLRHRRSPLTQPEIDLLPVFRALAEDERRWLKGLGAEVYVPICAKNEWIGMLAVGPRASGAAFGDEHLALLSLLADQTAVALENTRLVEGLMRLNNEFRRAYAALDQANRHLERLDRTKSDFISVASHELRTPLTLISGSSQMLLDEPALQQNPYHKQLLDKILSGTQRLHEVTDSMLDIAKIDARDLQLDPQPLSLNVIVETVCADLRAAITERKLTVQREGLRTLPRIQADLDALYKVFYHLIVNAIKYTPDGGKITISGQLVEAGPERLAEEGVEIVVSDTGIGIDPRYQELIFVKFYQTGELSLHSTGRTKHKGAGPGLGLAIARGIVEAHEGKVWVESEGYNEQSCPGSQFHVLLPLKLEQANWGRKEEMLLQKEICAA